MTGAIEYDAYEMRKPGLEFESVDDSAPVKDT